MMCKTVNVYHHIMQWKLAIFVAKNAHQRRKDRLWNVMSFRNVWYTKFAAFCVFLAFGIVSQGSRHWPTSSMTYFCVISWKSNNSCVVSRFFRLSSISWIESLTLRQSDVLLLPISPLRCEFCVQHAPPPHHYFERIFWKGNKICFPESVLINLLSLIC